MVKNVSKAESTLPAYVLYKRVLVVYECPFSEASKVLEAVLSNPSYRSHHCSFVGRWPADDNKPMVQIEVEFALST